MVFICEYEGEWFWYNTHLSIDVFAVIRKHHTSLLPFGAALSFTHILLHQLSRSGEHAFKLVLLYPVWLVQVVELKLKAVLKFG